MTDLIRSSLESNSPISSFSCEKCKILKRKCDRQLPSCSHCVKTQRLKPNHCCKYVPPAKRGRKPKEKETFTDRLAETESGNRKKSIQTRSPEISSMFNAMNAYEDYQKEREESYISNTPQTYTADWMSSYECNGRYAQHQTELPPLLMQNTMSPLFEPLSLDRRGSYMHSSPRTSQLELLDVNSPLIEHQTIDRRGSNFGNNNNSQIRPAGQRQNTFAHSSMQSQSPIYQSAFQQQQSSSPVFFSFDPSFEGSPKLSPSSPANMSAPPSLFQYESFQNSAAVEPVQPASTGTKSMHMDWFLKETRDMFPVYV